MTAEGQPVVRIPAAPASPAADPLADPRAMQILSTEHWSLLSARSLAYNEAFARAGMFLTFLSASLIVIGFIVASDAVADVVLPVIAMFLAVDLVIGLATLGRLNDSSSEEFNAIRGMNRIRHAYTEMVPGIDRYFVAPIHDDARGVLASFGLATSHSTFGNLVHGITTTLGMVALIDCLLVAALLAVLAVAAGAALSFAIALGVVVFVVAFVALSVAGMRAAMRAAARRESRYPTPD
jgi:hypothetical protein